MWRLKSSNDCETQRHFKTNQKRTQFTELRELLEIFLLDWAYIYIFMCFVLRFLYNPRHIASFRSKTGFPRCKNLRNVFFLFRRNCFPMVCCLHSCIVFFFYDSRQRLRFLYRKRTQRRPFSPPLCCVYFVFLFTFTPLLFFQLRPW